MEADRWLSYKEETSFFFLVSILSSAIGSSCICPMRRPNNSCRKVWHGSHLVEHYSFENPVSIHQVRTIFYSSRRSPFSPVHIGSVGNIKPDENPTHYRSPRQYIDMCQSRILNGQTEQVYELVSAKALESYYEIKKNNNQVNIEEKWKHVRRIRFRFVFSSPKPNCKTITVIKPYKISSIIRSTRRKVFRSMNPFVVKGMWPLVVLYYHENWPNDWTSLHRNVCWTSVVPLAAVLFKSLR